jgi:hypothetical protein
VKRPAKESSLRFRYWPCLGAWPVVLVLLLAIPCARWMRRDALLPSSVVCTSAFRPLSTDATRVGPTCMALDSRAVRTWTTLPCSASAAALVALLETRSPLHRPLIYATETGGLGRDLAPFPGADPSSGIDETTALSLLNTCTLGPDAKGSPRTLSVVMLDRDYGPSAILYAALLGAALLLGLRRRIHVSIDIRERMLVAVERGFLFEKRTVALAANEVLDVVVDAGAVGFLSGRRVEIVRTDQTRVPLASGYVPLTYGVHHQAARRLRVFLLAMRSVRAQPEGS